LGYSRNQNFQQKDAGTRQSKEDNSYEKEGYIEQYRKIYRAVIQEAKRRENNNCIRSAKNKSKAAWQVINKELGESFINKKNIELRWKNK
jgi:thermostable 8-oxoguanine DNA glycosylase